MRKLDFYGLPRALQDRLIESSQGVAVPRPLAVLAEPDLPTRNWAIAAVGAGVLWAGFTALGFGDLTSSLAIGGLPHLLVHLLFAGVASYCGLRAYASSWQTSRLPYGSGVFLFPSCLLRASGSTLVEIEASELVSVEASGSSVVVKTSGHTFQLPVATVEQAEEAARGFREGAARWADLGPASTRERARLSPLIESGVPNPLAPTDPHPRPRLLSPALLGGMTLLLAVTLGYAVSYLRTSLSEAALYRAAVTENTVESLEAYLARGGARPEVKDVYLPRARLALAKAKGSVQAIEEFQKAHPDSRIAAEASLALRDALLAELGRAKQKKTLTAVDQFKGSSPHTALVASEIAHARREVITLALTRFQDMASAENAAVVPFFQRLLAHAEAHGPKVTIRIRQDFPQQPESVDNVVLKSKKYYLGKKVLPSQYFLGDYARGRERQLLENVRARLQAAFPEDILHFELAPLPSAVNEELPPPTGPTLTLQHQSRLSGGYVGGAPKTMFMGAAIFFKATFEVPEGEPLEDKMTLWRPPRFAPFGAEREKDIPEVYEDMAGGAFEIYQRHLLGAWFKAPPEG
jgi:hypothetical protein